MEFNLSEALVQLQQHSSSISDYPIETSFDLVDQHDQQTHLNRSVYLSHSPL